MSARDDYPNDFGIADDPMRMAALDIDIYNAMCDEIDRLRAGLVDAREMVADWAGYASEYFQTKWNLAGDLERLDQLIRVTRS